jgi:hypothetical protein
MFMNSHVLSSMFSTLKPRIMPIFERRVGVKTSGLDANLRELGSPISLPGALQFVSDLKREHWKPNAYQHIP